MYMIIGVFFKAQTAFTAMSQIVLTATLKIPRNNLVFTLSRVHLSPEGVSELENLSSYLIYFQIKARLDVFPSIYLRISNRKCIFD